MDDPAAPKYERPKVILIDLANTEVQRVRGAGFAVTEGTLGQPLEVRRADRLVTVQSSLRAPGYAEQEVVVVQLGAPEGRPMIDEDAPPQTQRDQVWASMLTGVVDPRPWGARTLTEYTQRILEHGGVVVVFCEPRVLSRLHFGRGGNQLDWSVWDFLPDAGSIETVQDHGQEITATSIDSLRALRPFLEDATFNCTLTPYAHLEKRWIPLARNKYGHTVAGALAVPSPAEDSDAVGFVFLLPQVREAGPCIVALLEDVLPRLTPKLFPQTENRAWLQQPPFELPRVIELSGTIAEVSAEAEARITGLRDEIDRERESNGWMHTLLTAQGDELVQAVATALAELGLEDVRPVDDEAEEQQQGRRREDIQVLGRSPIMLVEVKGIANLPREAGALQVSKYLVPRMKRWNRTDVRGLAVINQQRGLPALARDNVNTVQEDVIDNAAAGDFGVMTTLDLFKLVRNKRRWDWPADAVAPLLYENGRIPTIHCITSPSPSSTDSLSGRAWSP